MKEVIKFVTVDDPFAIDTQGRCWEQINKKWRLTAFDDESKFTWFEFPDKKVPKVIDDSGALGE